MNIFNNLKSAEITHSNFDKILCYLSGERKSEFSISIPPEAGWGNGWRARDRGLDRIRNAIYRKINTGDCKCIKLGLVASGEATNTWHRQTGYRVPQMGARYEMTINGIECAFIYQNGTPMHAPKMILECEDMDALIRAAVGEDGVEPNPAYRLVNGALQASD